MRSINVLRNSAYALGSFALTSLLAIIVRKYFTVYLSIELLGIEGLFSNIITLLSLAELGIGSIINYNLYKVLANNDTEEINVLMNIYRQIYTLIGITVFIIGILLFFFLPYIVKNTTLPWFYIQFVYIVQICTVLSTYFLAYKRTLLMSDQKDYMCIRIDMLCNICSNVVRLLAIVCLQSYVLYSALGLVFNIVANIVIANRVRQQYPFIHNIKVTFQDIRDRNLIKDVKNLLVQRLAGFVYGGADAVFLSSMMGLRVTGLFANYQLIDKGIFSIMYKALQGVVPSIGNLVYEGDKEKSLKVFWMLDFFYLIFASYLSAIYAILFQPFMNLFFGEAFLLPEITILMMALNVFTMVQFENLCNFRAAVGMFGKDRNMIIISAVVKLSVAIFAIHYLGVAGLILASWLGWFCIGYGRFNIVFSDIFNGQDKSKYILRHINWSVIEILIIAMLYIGFKSVGFYQSYFQLFCSGVVVFALLTIANFIVFGRTLEFKGLIKYANNVFEVLRSKWGK